MCHITDNKHGPVYICGKKRQAICDALQMGTGWQHVEREQLILYNQIYETVSS